MPSVDDKRARVKVQCIPLEFPASGSAKRWFLDSDCGKKMSGEYITDEFTNGVFNGTTTSDGSVLDRSEYYEFFCLKNNADIGVLVEFGNNSSKNATKVLIPPGEIFAWKPSSAAFDISYTKIHAVSGAPNVEYYVGY